MGVVSFVVVARSIGGHRGRHNQLSRLTPDGDRAYRHVGEGRLLLGTWQGLFLREHRAEPQHRSVVVTVLGE